MGKHLYFQSKLKVFIILFGFLLILFACNGKAPKPSEKVDIEVCIQSGLLPNAYCPTKEVRSFDKGKEPTVQCQSHKAPEYIEVQVCKISGLLPNSFRCLETEFRKFEREKEPTSICQIHKKPELKKLLYVAAYDLLTTEGEMAPFIRTNAVEGATGERVMFQYAWGDNVLSPYPQVGFWRAGYADAPDLPFYNQGTEETPAWNEGYWKKVDDLNSLLAYYEQGIYADVHEGCSFRMGGWMKYRYPFLSSSPDRSKDDPEINRYPGGFWGMQEYSGGRRTVQFLHERLIRKLVEGWRSKGIPFKIEFVNEDPMTDWPADYIKAYYKYMAGFLESLGIPRSDIIGSGRREGFEYLGLYSIHGISRPEDVPNSNYSHEKIIISTDGGFLGAGRPDSKGRRGPDGDQAAAIAQKILDLNYIGFEIMDRGIYLKNNDRSCLNDFNPETMIRAVKILKK